MPPEQRASARRELSRRHLGLGLDNRVYTRSWTDSRTQHRSESLCADIGITGGIARETAHGRFKNTKLGDNALSRRAWDRLLVCSTAMHSSLSFRAPGVG